MKRSLILNGNLDLYTSIVLTRNNYNQPNKSLKLNSTAALDFLLYIYVYMKIANENSFIKIELCIIHNALGADSEIVC